MNKNQNSHAAIAWRHFIGFAAACLICSQNPAPAQTSFTWDGGDSSSPLWSTAGNWNPDGAPANSFAANFSFSGAVNSGTAGTPLNNDLTGGSITNLTFDVGAGTFYLAGNSVTIWGGITNNSGAPQVLNTPLAISTNNPANTNPHWINVGSGSITNGSPISAPTVNATMAKIGAGTLVLNSPLTNTLGNGTPGGTPFVAGFLVDEGTVIFDGGPTSLYNVTGEVAFGRLAPTGNKNVTVILQSGKLASTTWMGIGRGNGVGDVSADLILNGSSVFNPVNWSGCFNAGDATRRPRGSVTQNGTSLFFVNNNNNNNNFAESTGAYVVHAVNDSATLQIGSGVEGSVARARIGISGRQVIKLSSPTATVIVGQTHFGDAAGGAGALYNRGTFKVTSVASTDHFSIGSASGGANPTNNGYGYYLNDTPTIGLKEIGVGGAGSGDGVLEVRQGQIWITNWITMCRGTSTTVGAQQNSLLMIRNGTIFGPNLNQNYMLQSGSGIAQISVLDIGAGGKLGSQGPIHAMNLANANNGLSSGTVTLSGGGLIEISSIFAGQAGPVTTINFNNGTLKAMINTATLLGNNIDGVYVHAGGATFDTAGFNVSLVPQLQSPIGNGITSVPVATPGVGYIGRPIVRITDPSGVGATAIAEWNEASGTITGVTITCSGSGYSSPTAVLVGGGFTNAATFGAPVLGPVASGGLTKTGAGTLTLTGGGTYTGPTVVNGGTLAISPGAPFSSSGFTITNSALNVDASSGSSVNMTSLTLQNNATNNLNFGTVTANPSVPAINLSGSLSAPGSGIVINIEGFGLKIGQFPLIDYTGAALGSIANFSLGPLPPGVVATLVNNTANTSIDLNITSAGQNLTWSGSDALTGLINPNWDIAATTNWFLFGSTTPARYQEYTTTLTVGDPVRFDDSLTNDFVNPPPTNVNVTTTVRPFKITVDNTVPYSFIGAGSIAGVGSLVKSNSGTLLIATSNSYTGGTFLFGGSVAISNDTALGAAASTLTLNGGALQVLRDITNTRPVNVLATSPLNVSNGVTARLGGRFTGNGSRVLFQDTGTAILTNATTLQFHIQQGTVIFDANARITNTVNFTSVGPGTSAGENGNLIIRSNATFDITTDCNIADTQEATGRLDIQNNAIVRTVNFWVGKFNTAVGRVFQTGGALTNTATTGADWRVGGENAAASGAFGGYYLSGGRVDFQKNFQIGANGTGEMIITGGAVNQWAGFPVVGRFTNGVGLLVVSGGQFNQLNTGQFLIIGEQGTGTLVISNTGVVNLTNTLRLAHAGGGIGTVNLAAGGRLITAGVLATGPGVSATFNFNGGTIQPNASSTAFMQNLTDANVLPGGAIIDCLSNNITIAQPLLAAGGGLTKLGTGALTLTGSNTYSGATIVSAGRLLVAPAHQTPGTVTVADGAGLGVFVNSAGKATVGNLTLGTAGATTFDVVLAAGGNPTTPPMQVGTFILNGTSSVRLSGQLAVGTFPILQYSGLVLGTGSFSPTVTGPQGMVATLSNHVAGSTLYVTVTSLGVGLVWTGTNSGAGLTNLWDLNSTTNWLSGSSPTFYQEIVQPGDSVTFNDTGTGAVLLNRVASPANVLFNDSINYSLSGTGRISGVTGVTKQGTGTVTLGLSGSDYTGDTTISAGTLRLGSATSLPDGASAGNLIVSATGSVDLNGFSETINGLIGSGNIGNSSATAPTLTLGNGGKAVTWGGGIDSTGGGIALTKVGTNTMTITGVNYLRAGNTAVNGGLTLLTNGGTVIVTTGEYWIANGANTIATNIVHGGTLVVSNWLAIGRNAASANGTLIVNSGTVQKAGGNNIVLGSLGANGTLIVNGGQVLNNGMLWLGENAGASGSLYLNGGLVQATQVRPNGTGQALSVAVFNGGVLQATASSADFIQSLAAVQTGGVKLDSGVFNIALATQPLQEDPLSPGGGLIKLGSGTLTLATGNTYSGLTIVSNGTLRVDGSIPGNVNVKSGATLGGIGTISGVVTVENGGAIGAGDSIGTLNLGSAPVLNGAVIAELDRNAGTPLADVISLSGNAITYGGSLVLTNIGAPLQVGDTFKLFNATGYSGSFALVSQTPQQTVTWNTANLTANGTISVATVSNVSATPTNIAFSVSGNTLSLSWPADHLGWTLQTNAVGITATGSWFPYPGSVSVTSVNITIDRSRPNVFFRLVLP